MQQCERIDASSYIHTLEEGGIESTLLFVTNLIDTLKGCKLIDRILSLVIRLTVYSTFSFGFAQRRGGGGGVVIHLFDRALGSLIFTRVIFEQISVYIYDDYMGYCRHLHAR